MSGDATDWSAGSGVPEGSEGEVFSARSRRDGSRAVLEIAGELDLTTVDPLAAAFREAIAGGADTLELDTSGVTFVDSRALAMFLAFQLNAPKEGVTMRMVAASPEFARVATVAGLEEDLLPPPDAAATDDANDSDDRNDRNDGDDTGSADEPAGGTRP
ncbi:MAG TPA: STAS domain-containing protein [Acidimicrobiales bacterium]